MACDHNDTLLTVDLTTRTVTAATTVGQNPDVLAYDPGAHRLVVAAESGIVTTFDLQGQTLTGAGPEFLAEDAHVVAVDPATHRRYYPIPHDRDGHPCRSDCRIPPVAEPVVLEPKRLAGGVFPPASRDGSQLSAWFGAGAPACGAALDRVWIVRKGTS